MHDLPCTGRKCLALDFELVDRDFGDAHVIGSGVMSDGDDCRDHGSGGVDRDLFKFN